MKKLYRKGTVHPCSPPSSSSSSSSSSSISDQFISLSYLPAAILTLAAALSAEDKEVLAYLLSCSTTTPFDFDPSKSHKKHPIKTYTKSNSSNNNNNHVSCFTCYCFSCYTSYWARWDSSPNRQLIHEIIDAFEDGLLAQKKKKQGVNKREKKKNNNNNVNKNLDYGSNIVIRNDCSKGSEGSIRVNSESGRVGSVEEVQGQLVDNEAGEKQGSVRKMVSFIGEKIWGSVWG